MTAWLLAAVVACALAALSYAPAARAGQRLPLAAALRAAAVLLLAAAAFDAPVGRVTRPIPIVALDASASWSRAAAPSALDAARDSARAAGGAFGRDSLLLAGDSARAGDASAAGRDGASRLADATDRAAAAGRPLVFVTDGEPDDPAALARAPRGSRVVAVRPARGADAAVLDADAPRAASTRDTLDVRATVAADATGAPAGRLRLLVGGRVLADSARPALAPFARTEVRLRAALVAGAGPQPLQVVSLTTGDREPRNDTLALALDVTDAPAAVFVSGAPDYDVRLLLGVLRGTLGTPVRAYLRVAPGQWRAEGTLASVSEAEVRRAAAAASLIVIHGDTAALGPPRALGRGALALVAPPAAANGSAEWFASAAPPSPVQGALADVAWDSLPPLDVGAAPTGTWTGLVARVGRGGPARSVVAGVDAPRLVLVAAAGGFWRWQFRAGRSAEAATALWGALFDWLAAGRGDLRAAVPDRPAVRAGEPVRWRRGGADSVVLLTVQPGGASNARADTVVLRFAAGTRTAESPARAPGVYTVRGPGGVSLLAVNASPELLPRRPALASGPVGSAAAAAGTAPRLRDAGWPYAAAVVLLCAEWLLRRRRGLR